MKTAVLLICSIAACAAEQQDSRYSYLDYSLLMVVGGSFQKDTQLIDLTSANQSCPKWGGGYTQSINKGAEYPIALQAATGSIVYGEPDVIPIVCGGVSKEPMLTVGSLDVNDTNDTFDECYMMNMKHQSWTFLTKMNQRRSDSASVTINGSLFVTGGSSGYDDSNYLSSTEYVTPDGLVSAGPDLPSARKGHCMVTLPTGKVMIIGGFPTTDSVIIFDPITNSFISQPSLINGRAVAGCAVFKSPAHNLRPIVMVVGGFRNGWKAEIYDFTKPNSRWTEIPSLPRDHITDLNDSGSFRSPSVVTSPSGQGAIVQNMEYLYELKCRVNGCFWSILSQKLTRDVESAVLFPLPAGFKCQF